MPFTDRPTESWPEPHPASARAARAPSAAAHRGVLWSLRAKAGRRLSARAAGRRVRRPVAEARPGGPARRRSRPAPPPPTRTAAGPRPTGAAARPVALLRVEGQPGAELARDLLDGARSALEREQRAHLARRPPPRAGASPPRAPSATPTAAAPRTPPPPPPPSRRPRERAGHTCLSDAGGQQVGEIVVLEPPCEVDPVEGRGRRLHVALARVALEPVEEAREVGQLAWRAALQLAPAGRHLASVGQVPAASDRISRSIPSR